MPGVVVDDHRRPCGWTALEERLGRIQGIDKRERLTQEIVDHDMYRPSKDNEWFYNSTNHVVR